MKFARISLIFEYSVFHPDVVSVGKCFWNIQTMGHENRIIPTGCFIYILNTTCLLGAVFFLSEERPTSRQIYCLKWDGWLHKWCELFSTFVQCGWASHRSILDISFSESEIIAKSFSPNIVDINWMVMMSAVHASVTMLLQPGVAILSATRSLSLTSFDDRRFDWDKFCFHSYLVLSALGHAYWPKSNAAFLIWYARYDHKSDNIMKPFGKYGTECKMIFLFLLHCIKRVKVLTHQANHKALVSVCFLNTTNIDNTSTSQNNKTQLWKQNKYNSTDVKNYI